MIPDAAGRAGIAANFGGLALVVTPWMGIDVTDALLLCLAALFIGGQIALLFIPVRRVQAVRAARGPRPVLFPRVAGRPAGSAVMGRAAGPALT